MSSLRPTFYVDTSVGVTVDAVLQILELLDANVARTLPPLEEKAAYIVIDFGMRRTRIAQQNWMDAWYEARGELGHPGTLIGLTLEEGNDPVSGACQISISQVLPQLTRLFDRAPRELSEAEVNHQKQPVEKRQAQIVAHDLQHVLNTATLNSRTAHRSLARTLQVITLPALRSELNDLLKRIERTADGALLRNLLVSALTHWRALYER